MCSQSVSGSSLLSGYNEDDARETNGRSRREFEEIDAVLYDEEKPKRSSIKKICEEWSSKPHFRIRGRLQHIEKQPIINLPLQLIKQHDIPNIDITSTPDLLITNNSKSNELNVLLGVDAASGRSSINSIEGSDLTNNSDIDEDDATNTILNDRFSGDEPDSFDTDEDDDENNDISSNIPKNHQSRSKHPQFLKKRLKDNIMNSLTTELLQRFFTEQQSTLQRYAKFLYARNSIKLRPKLRPYSLPPRSLSQNRYSLPVGSSITATSTLLQLTSSTLRGTPEPGVKLNGLLRVTQMRITNSGSNTNSTTTPRKSQNPPALPPPIPPPTERTATSLIIDKRNQQQISLIGTAVANPPSIPPSLPPAPANSLTQSIMTTTTTTTAANTITTTPSSQNQIRQTPSSYRYRSATTTNTNIQNFEPNTRLPPINIERITTNDQLIINRSNTTTGTIIESNPPMARAVSGTSIGSNLSATNKLRTSTNPGKLQRTSRPITITSINNNKDFNNSTSTSPARSITATNPPSSSLRTTAATRTQQQQQQKRPLVTTKTPQPPPPGVIKVTATHIY